MTHSYNLTVANLVKVRAAGVSYHLTLVPSQSQGGSTRPHSYLTDDELRKALLSLGLTEGAVAKIFDGVLKDGYYWLPGIQLTEDQCNRFGLLGN